ncbi:hypothetical protein B0T17DRAFT_488166 [Bombardia bombarda]|uniref:Tyrosinase copper-binding domain-containing protein n=1 Tax=Bombardia bombarda TaxID=252184 RepID=A0AA40C803_9PEZI|nr:hypothetical protein B0T17DRAFT_488166 [Bombardia bombarda]
MSWRNIASYTVLAAILLPPSWVAAAQSTPIPVVGIKTGIDTTTGRRPARQNINDLYARGGPQWDLYILALSSLQAVNETDELSYFRIAGIHGLPYSAWNGVEQVPGAPDGTGYCPHGQTLVSHAVDIASRYPPNTAPTYQAAAQTLRQPYWDWASDARLPRAVLAVNVTVNGPDGGKITLRNPLYSYRFQPGSVQTGFGGYLAGLPETARCRGADGRNNGTASDEKMVEVAKDLMREVYDVFTRTSSFDAMAYNEWYDSSFENPHNAVHNYAGCGGTLGDLGCYADFNPSMLHHCNVDRLVAMWQAIYYQNSMFTTTSTSSGEFGTPKGTVITADSPLKPFFRDKKGNFQTSNSVTSIKTFGYTYPEINDWSMTAEGLAVNVRAKVNKLYSQSEVPLPSTVNLVVDRKFAVARMSMLSMPSSGVAFASLLLGDVMLGNGGTTSLQESGPEVVVPFLRENLAVEIRLNDGSKVPVPSESTIQLDIQSTEYWARSGDSQFPRFGNASKWPVRVCCGE